MEAGHPWCRPRWPTVRHGCRRRASHRGRIHLMAVARSGFVSLDCADPIPLAEFWASMLGGKIHVRERYYRGRPHRLGVAQRHEGPGLPAADVARVRCPQADPSGSRGGRPADVGGRGSTAGATLPAVQSVRTILWMAAGGCEGIRVAALQRPRKRAGPGRCAAASPTPPWIGQVFEWVVGDP